MRLTALLALIMLLSACTPSHPYGVYYNKHRFWGDLYVLQPDSSFYFARRANSGRSYSYADSTYKNPNADLTVTVTEDTYFFTDSASGTYSLQDDTLYFHYTTDTIKGDFNGYNQRPARLLWQNHNLHYFFKDTNIAIRDKEYQLQFSRERTRRHLYSWPIALEGGGEKKESHP